MAQTYQKRPRFASLPMGEERGSLAERATGKKPFGGQESCQPNKDEKPPFAGCRNRISTF